MILVASTSLLACGEVGDEYLHADNTISAIQAQPFNASASAQPVQGTINDETGEILIAIPKTQMSYYDLTEIILRATVGYDAVITPSLSGIKDLSSPYSITVEATQTGEKKSYTIQAYYDRN